VFSGGQKSRNNRDAGDEDENPGQRKLPPGGRLPPLNHKSNGVAGRRQDSMYDDEDDDDDDDDEEEEMNTKGRPRSATGGRRLPPLAMGDLGGKDNQKNQGRTAAGTAEAFEVTDQRKMTSD